MNFVKRFCHVLLLPVILSWFMMTVFVDIIAVPTVFRNVTKVVEAGKVGMTIFSTFNKIEFIFALIVVIGAIKIYNKEKKNFYLVLSLVLFIWSIAYNLYFTPQIIHYTTMIHSTLPGDPAMIDYQSSHAFFHKLYRYLDTTKLIMLLTFLIVLVRNKLSEEK